MDEELCVALGIVARHDVTRPLAEDILYGYLSVQDQE
jgi:hypothetical protein